MATKRTNQLVQVSDIARIHQVHLDRDSPDNLSGHALLIVPQWFEKGRLAIEIEQVYFEFLIGGKVIDFYCPFETTVEVDQTPLHIVTGLLLLVEQPDLDQWVVDHFPNLKHVRMDKDNACWVPPELEAQARDSGFSINPRAVLEAWEAST